MKILYVLEICPIATLGCQT